MDGAEIGIGSIIAAGTVVHLSRVPAKFAKNVEGNLKDVFQRTANNYIMYNSFNDIHVGRSIPGCSQTQTPAVVNNE